MPDQARETLANSRRREGVWRGVVESLSAATDEELTSSPPLGGEFFVCDSSPAEKNLLENNRNSVTASVLIGKE